MHSVSEFYRQTDFRIARKPTNHGVFCHPDRLAWEIIGFSAESHGADTRLIQCWHAFQRNTITHVPRVVSEDPPKFLRAFRSFCRMCDVGSCRVGSHRVHVRTGGGRGICRGNLNYIEGGGRLRRTLTRGLPMSRDSALFGQLDAPGQLQPYRIPKCSRQSDRSRFAVG